jgi:hypothetical protein
MPYKELLIRAVEETQASIREHKMLYAYLSHLSRLSRNTEMASEAMAHQYRMLQWRGVLGRIGERPVSREALLALHRRVRAARAAAWDRLRAYGLAPDS